MRAQTEPPVRELAYERDRARAARVFEAALHERASHLAHALLESGVAHAAQFQFLREHVRNERLAAAQRAPLRPERRAERAPRPAVARMVAVDDPLRVGAGP